MFAPVSLESIVAVPPSCVVYGPTGSGKTALARTLPVSVVLGFDRNAAVPVTVTPIVVPDVAAPALPVMSIPDAADRRAMVDLFCDAADYARTRDATLVIDDMTELSHALMSIALTERNSDARSRVTEPDLPTFGAYASLVGDIFEALRRRPVAVLWLAQERGYRPARRNKGRPDDPAEPAIPLVAARALLDRVSAGAQLVAQLQVSGDARRVLNTFGADNRAMIKCSLPMPDMLYPDMRLVYHHLRYCELSVSALAAFPTPQWVG